MGTPVSFTVEDGQLTADLGSFVTRLAGALAPFVAYLASPGFRGHPRWRGLMPFDVPSYGVTGSLGHCVRPDVIPTKDGPRICELDFVPSGRGFVLEGLASTGDREQFLRAFMDWYESMGHRHVAYATATRTVCLPETRRFAELMRQVTQLDVRAVNIDRDQVDPRALIDRLFYRSSSMTRTRPISALWSPPSRGLTRRWCLR
jgi:hypothetical protein